MTINIGFYVGSAESTSLGLLVFSSEEFEPGQVKEAFKDLSVFLFDYFLEDEWTPLPQTSRLCKEDHEKVGTPFCAHCGAELVEPKPSSYHFEEWISGLLEDQLHQWHPLESTWTVHPQEDVPIEVVAWQDGEKEIAKHASEVYPEGAQWDL